MNTLRAALTFLTITSVVGCASTKQEQGSVYMEDVIVEHKIVRSTSNTPRPRGGPIVSGDNITIGTMIVNSPGAKVDNSVHMSQSVQGGIPRFGAVRSNDNYDADRDFFKKTSENFGKVVPGLMMMFIK